MWMIDFTRPAVGRGTMFHLSTGRMPTTGRTAPNNDAGQASSVPSYPPGSVYVGVTLIDDATLRLGGNRISSSVLTS